MSNGQHDTSGLSSIIQAVFVNLYIYNDFSTSHQSTENETHETSGEVIEVH